MPPSVNNSPTNRFLPWIVATALFMQTLDSSILNTALPAMARALNESPLHMQSAVISYLLTVAILIPASGWLADRFGSRRVFVTSIALFSLGSLLCALSQTLSWLVAGRVTQGIGGALMMPVGRLVILRSYPRGDLVRVLSFVTIPGLLGPLMGPTLGGWLVDYASWHWIFLINLPVGLLGCLAASHFMPTWQQTARQPFDWPGFILITVAMILISMAFEGLGELNLPHARVLLMLAGGLATLAAYGLHSTRSEHPLFSPRLFQVHSFAVGIVGNLFARLGIGAMPFLTPLLLQLGLGFSPTQAGTSMIPMALASIVAKPIAPRLIDRFGFRNVLSINTLLLGLMISGFALLGTNTPLPLLYAYLAVFGGINSTQFSAMNGLTLIDLGPDTAASGNSLLSVVMQLSISLGVAAAAALLGGFVDLRNQPDSQVLLGAFHKTYLCVGLMTAFAAAIFMQLKRETCQGKEDLPPRSREDDAA